MAELTDVQVELAAAVMYTSEYPKERWPELDDRIKSTYRKLARTAAPLLQLPWNEVITYDEAKSAQEVFLKENMTVALAKFVARRNTKILPKPVDPRREQLLVILDRVSRHEVAPSNVVDDILVAFGGVK